LWTYGRGGLIDFSENDLKLDFIRRFRPGDPPWGVGNTAKKALVLFG
jgi:hypothetical protein